MVKSLLSRIPFGFLEAALIVFCTFAPVGVIVWWDVIAAFVGHELHDALAFLKRLTP
jgi:hypothetical protein